MAQNLILVTVYGENKTAISTPYSKYINPLWIKEINSQTNNITGANSAIQYFLSGPAGGSFVTLQVSQTQAELVAAANGSSTALVNRTAVAFPSSATIALGDMSKGLFTNTGASGAVNITLRTATELAAELGASVGSTYEFVVATPVAQAATVVVGSGITGVSDLTGGTDLSVSASGAGVFKLTFLSTTAAIISRLA